MWTIYCQSHTLKGSVGTYSAERSAPRGTGLISLWILSKLLTITIAGDDESADYFGHIDGRRDRLRGTEKAR